MTCFEHLKIQKLHLETRKTLTFTQLIQMACELELEINKRNKQEKDPKVHEALENASEHVPHIVEWLTTAKKETTK
jgi:hypothetical protein